MKTTRTLGAYHRRAAWASRRGGTSLRRRFTQAADLPRRGSLTETIDPPASRKTTIALAVVLLVIVAGRAASGADTAFHFSGPPVDGPFQLLNALRRIAAGQRGGADFQFFHGLGVPYLHYLPFRLFGGDLTASELSRQLIAILAYPVVVVLFIRAFVQDWSCVLALALIVYCVSILLPRGSGRRAIGALA